MPLPQHAPALVVTEPGGRDVLEVQALPVPRPGPGEVLVEVAAAGVNFIDVYQRQGVYPTPTPFVLGQEGAGVVAAVGAGVSPSRIGERVAWSMTQGAMARFAAVAADRLVPVPEGVGLDVAAAVLLQGLTAHYLVTSTYAVQPGEVCVVHAAAGGVGQLLTQLIASRGGRVVATAGGERKCAIARARGAEVVIDTAGTDDLVGAVAAATRSLDPAGAAVAYDGVGAATFESSLSALRRRGTFVLFGAASGQVPPLDLQRLNRGGSLFATRPNLADYLATPEELRWRAGEVFEAVARGALHLQVSGRYALTDARAAYEALEGRRTTGKVLLLPGSGYGAGHE